MKREIKLKEVTPKQFKCGIGACPAIFKTGNKFIIIGKVVNDEMNRRLKKRIGKDDAGIEIPKELLLNLKQ